jgi:UTP--glucose-1-phosphate uridylyltransferase
MFGDDMTLTNSKKPVTKQLIDVYNKQNADIVVAVQEVPWDEVNKYGVVGYKKTATYKYEIDEQIEKPAKEKAPSNMAVFGRYVFNYDIIRETEKTSLGVGNELWVTDAVNSLAKKGKKVIAQPIDGEWVTTGDPLNYIKATIKFGLNRPDLADDIKAILNSLK